MISTEQNIALLTIGNEAIKKSEWVDFGNYCFEREKGLRKEAFRYLDSFLTSTQHWSDDNKIEFAKFLFPFFETLPQADYATFPKPLSEKLLEPTLLNWCEMEKEDYSPFRWYGKYYRSEDHLLKALEICPTDDIARQVLIEWWTYHIYYSVHHLPEGYIGDPKDDIKLGEKIKLQISQLTTNELREYWFKELEEDLILVENYIDWQVSGNPSFEKWGEENKKQTGYGLTRVYYYEK